jgi:hypothetical protein
LNLIGTDTSNLMFVLFFVFSFDLNFNENVTLNLFFLFLFNFVILVVFLVFESFPIGISILGSKSILEFNLISFVISS